MEQDQSKDQYRQNNIKLFIHFAEFILKLYNKTYCFSIF